MPLAEYKSLWVLRKILLNSFVYSNFNYCPLLWDFSLAKSVKNIEKIKEQAIETLYNDISSVYESILNKSDKSTIEVNRLRTLAELYLKH